MTDFNTALTAFLSAAQARINADFAERYPNLRPDVLTIDPQGVKYLRIVTTRDGGNGQRSVYLFIEKATGNILKAESWKKPAKHPRGNIYAADPLAGTTIHGAEYLR